MRILPMRPFPVGRNGKFAANPELGSGPIAVKSVANVSPSSLEAAPVRLSSLSAPALRMLSDRLAIPPRGTGRDRGAGNGTRHRVAAAAMLPQRARLHPLQHLLQLEPRPRDRASADIIFLRETCSSVPAIAIDRPPRHARDPCEILNGDEPLAAVRQAGARSGHSAIASPARTHDRSRETPRASRV